MPVEKIIALALASAFILASAAIVALSVWVIFQHLPRRSRINKELLELVKEMYQWTHYKNTAWAKRAKWAITKAEMYDD
jgi:hypothetical protein